MAKVRNWTGDISKVVYTHVLLIGVPTIFYYCLRVGGMPLIRIHMAIATFFLLSSLVIFLEATNALFRRFAVKNKRAGNSRMAQFKHSAKSVLGVGGSNSLPVTDPLPRCSFLVAAYLPNEQDIILDTLKHILNKVQRSSAGLEVILAYNTPVDLPVEDDLRRLAHIHPELRLLRVDGSHSKAENLNAALHIVTGEITCILDADHLPAADCFIRAWRWLEHDYDVVQGRNIIRNHRHSLLTLNIAIEFETLYGVSHAAKSFLTDSSIFGGSNGYWRTTVLQQIRFNPAMLTEDIDASMRTLLSGYRILHDRSIITTELAPADFNSFWFQRKRWAQGWLEVSFKYQRRVWKSHNFTLWQKVYWTYLLYFCVLYSLIALQILPLILSLLLYQGDLPPSDNPFLWFSTVVTFSSGVYQTLVTMKVAAVRYPVMYFLQHAVIIFLYTILKNMIAVVGLYDHLSGHNKWVVTPRGSKKKRLLSTRKLPVLAPTAAGLGSAK
jgi:cellulose synthase/poly-beta-1,6-N-acetylglucosamine synthase-like glycosyltransferase